MIARALLVMAILLAHAPAAEEPTAITTWHGADVVLIAIPAGWGSTIVQHADRETHLALDQRILINGGYFDGQGNPAGLLITKTGTSGTLQQESPYSGFVWCDQTGAIHITRTMTPPEESRWAIQSGPLLVETGRCGINRSVDAAPRTVIALREGRPLLIRTGPIGLRELADQLVSIGISDAINLDGGPSSQLHARIGAVAIDRPGAKPVPYGIGFTPPP